MPQNKYIGTTEAARMTGLSIKEILGLLHDGTIPSHRTRRGHYRFLLEDLEKLGLVKQTAESPIEEEELEEEEPFVEEVLKEDGFSYVADEEHYTQVFKRMTEVKYNLKIATGDLKNFHVTIESKFLRLCDFFFSLVERGVHVQVISMEPEKFYNYTLRHCPQLLENPLFELRKHKHSHMKVFIFDDECAYIGSANITSAAIGKRNRNHEAGFLVWGENMMKNPTQHFETVWNSPDVIKTTWKRFTKSAKELEKEFERRYGK